MASNNTSFYGKDTTVFSLLQQKSEFMKHKRLSTITGGLAIMFLFAGCVEGLDGGITLWNFISLLLAFICGWISKWFEDHIDVTKKEGEK